MRKISLLDCTLRDGGYVNQWSFGKENIRSIISKLVLSGTELIECGYLNEKVAEDENCALFHDLSQLEKVYAVKKNKNQSYAVMINYGEYAADKLPTATEESPVIRVAFHKKDLKNAITYFRQLDALGYYYFVQPMGALNYSDAEFVALIEQVNTLGAKAFYVVDSFGVMELPDFKRLMMLADHNLASDKMLGYHSHNNLQQAYSNAKCMVELELQHDLIVDATVFGMGRGAGNLNIELFARYLNQYFEKQYKIEAFLEIFDECLKPIFVGSFWGYSLPFFLSSIHNCHPNYASYFSEKNTLTIKSMHELLSMIPDEEKVSFTNEKADQFYLQYQENFIDDSAVLSEIQSMIGSRKVLVLAPGRTLATHEAQVQKFIREYQPVIFSTNMAAEQYPSDYLFITNEKRYAPEMPRSVQQRIVTSNIKNVQPRDIRVNYSSYLITNSAVYDNPTLMLIQLLKSITINEVYFAGFDGFSASGQNNYFSDRLSLGTSVSMKAKKNKEISKVLTRLSESMHFIFLTPTHYQIDMQ